MAHAGGVGYIAEPSVAEVPEQLVRLMQRVRHAGSRLGAAFTPPIVVALMAWMGWKAPFVAFGFLGLIWAVVKLSFAI